MSGNLSDTDHPCPGMETWCAYLDGSVDDEVRGTLARHLATCDRCFSTVVSVRESLGAADEADPTVTTPPELVRTAQGIGGSPRRRWIRVYAAAAALALIALGLWQVLDSPGSPSERSTAEDAASHVDTDPPAFGFAAGQEAEQPGTRMHAVVIFAAFGDQVVGPPLPAGTGSLFDPDVPTSFAHALKGTALAGLEVRGTVLPRRYAARLPSAAEAAGQTAPEHRRGRFAVDILTSADAEVDFGRFDDDGVDGTPNSGDDDGYVDCVFVVVRGNPVGFWPDDDLSAAGLGLEGDFVTDDVAHEGGRIRVSAAVWGGGILSEGDLAHMGRAMLRVATRGRLTE